MESLLSRNNRLGLSSRLHHHGTNRDFCLLPSGYLQLQSHPTNHVQYLIEASRTMVQPVSQAAYHKPPLVALVGPEEVERTVMPANLRI